MVLAAWTDATLLVQSRKGLIRVHGAGLKIAEALQLNYVFVCEFEELRSPLRNARSQVSYQISQLSCSACIYMFSAILH